MSQQLNIVYDDAILEQLWTWKSENLFCSIHRSEFVTLNELSIYDALPIVIVDGLNVKFCILYPLVGVYSRDLSDKWAAVKSTDPTSAELIPQFGYWSYTLLKAPKNGANTLKRGVITNHHFLLLQQYPR